MNTLIQDSKELLSLLSSYNFSNLDSLKQSNQPTKIKEIAMFNNVRLDSLVNKLVVPFLQKNSINEKHVFCLNNPTLESFFYTLNVIFCDLLEKSKFQSANRQKLQDLQACFRKILSGNVFDNLNLQNPKHSWVCFRIIRALDSLYEQEFGNCVIVLQHCVDSWISNSYDSNFKKVVDYLDDDSKKLIIAIVSSSVFTEAVVKTSRKVLPKTLDEQQIRTSLNYIRSNLWTFLFICEGEGHTRAETLGNKCIFFSDIFFPEIANNKMKVPLSNCVRALFLINLIYELERLLIRHLLETINVFEQSPKSNDSGIKLEKCLFGSKVIQLGYDDTKFLIEKKNWSLPTKIFQKNFKLAAKKSKQSAKNNPRSKNYQIYVVGRSQQKIFICGTNLLANRRSQLEKLKLLESDENKKTYFRAPSNKLRKKIRKMPKLTKKIKKLKTK